MDLGVAGKAYLVVGGSAGMGLATAQVLAAEGADLVIVGRSQDRLDEAAKGLADRGGRVETVASDVSRSGAAETLVADALARVGDLAGVAVLTGTTGHESFDVPDEQWASVFDDVLMGTVRVVRAVVPHLISRGGGNIVTTAAYSVRSPKADRLPYGALKGAVAVFTKGIAKSYGAQGIRANCVCPGVIETAALHQYRSILATQYDIPVEEALERVMVDEWKMDVALGRPGQPEEVGELMAFLLSPRAGYLTGTLINIDGGTDF
jgi:NAD(P)-dependent dehydrogenase (short-subunit alcohol dehydrogenase family)